MKTSVLILVLMEDALVHFLRTSKKNKKNLVLILVLMEDALVRESTHQEESRFNNGLNPCFNGRCTRTKLSNHNSLPYLAS